MPDTNRALLTSSFELYIQPSNCNRSVTSGERGVEIQEGVGVRFVTARNLLLVVLGVGSIAGYSLSAAEITLCQTSCVCITWLSGTGARNEIRCTDGTAGWSTGMTVPGDGGGGTWSGPTTPMNPPSPLPGNVLSGEAYTAVAGAKKTAMERVRGQKVPGMKGVWEPTACTDLFAANPLGHPGAYLMGSYLEFRDGTGVKDDTNTDVCATGTVSAWTKCCQHDPVVFICPSKFVGLSPDVRATKIIHETLHVAGQFEDKNGTVGPGDPPNPSQIDDVVNAACN